MKWLRQIWARSGKQLRRLAGFLAAALFIGFGVQWLATSNARMIVSQPMSIHDIALSPDGQVLAVAYADGTVELRETNHKRALIRRFSLPGAAVMQLHLDDVTQVGLRLIMARADGRVILETARDGTPLSDELTIERSLLTPQFAVAEDGALWVQGVNERGAWLSRLEPDGTYAQPVGMAVSGPLQVKLLSATSDRAHVLTADQHLIWGTWDPETDYGLESPITIKHRLPLREGYVTLQDGHVMAAENGAWRSATGDFIEDETGVARIYGGGMQGARTANGEDFNPSAMTAAHRTLPLGSRVRVTNQDNGVNAVLRINDRVADDQIILLLTSAAATRLGFADNGVGNVRVRFLGVETEPNGIDLERVQFETSAAEQIIRHDGRVTIATYSNGGNLISTGSNEGNVKIWNGRTRFSQIVAFDAHEGAVTAVDFSPDDRLLVTGGDDAVVRVWDVQSGRLMNTHQDHSGSIRTAYFSPDGARIVTTSEDDTARVWFQDSDSVWQSEILQGHTADVVSAVFAPDNRQIVTAAFDSTARVWVRDADDMWQSEVLEGHDYWLRSARFSPDASVIVTTSDDGTARVWGRNASGSWQSEVLRGHSSVVLSAAFSPDGTQIATASSDQTVRVWARNSDSTWRNQLLLGHSDIVLSAEFSPDGSRIVSASRDGTARIWTQNEDGAWLSQVLPRHTDEVRSAKFSPDGGEILTGSDDGTAIIWAEIRPDVWAPKRGDLPCLSADGRAHLVRFGDSTLNSLWMWSETDGVCEITFDENYLTWTDPLPVDTTTVKFLNQESLSWLDSILVGRANGTVELRSRDAVQRYATYHGHGGAITEIETVNMGGTVRAAIAAEDGSIQIIDLPGGGASVFARANTGVSSLLSGLNELRVSAIDSVIPDFEVDSFEGDSVDPPSKASGSPFSYYPPGDLMPGSGTGYTEDTVFAPDIVFPIKDAPASVQSMVWRFGGGIGGGDQCDPRNYHPAWRDTYCETRSTSRNSPYCESDRVATHVSIRVGTAEDCNTLRSQAPEERSLHEVVAVSDGIITNIGAYTVTLTSENGSIYIYRYMNMQRLGVRLGDVVEAGQFIGYVSNDFGGTPTTFQLGFEIRQQMQGGEYVSVPPYMSLVRAYERREGVTGQLVTDDAVVVAPPPLIVEQDAPVDLSEPQTPIFYIHFESGTQSRDAGNLASIIQSMGYRAPLERDPDALPSSAQLRYFRRVDAGLARQVAESLSTRTNGRTNLRTVYFEGYEDSTEIRENHFEIWFAEPTQEPVLEDDAEYSLETQE